MKSLEAELVWEGHTVSLSKPRPREVNGDLVARVELTMERFPAYGYRRLACVLGENRKPV